MRPNSSNSSTPLSWSTPKSPRRARQLFHSVDDELCVRALEVPILDPSKMKQLPMFIPAMSDARNVFVITDGLEYLMPKISSTSKGQGNPFEKMLLWELIPDYEDWHGRYCIWFSKSQENFYVLRLGQTDEYKGRKVLMYESMPELDPDSRPAAIDGWIGHVIACLQKYEGCLANAGNGVTEQ